jgi:hypothetical protein
MQGAILIESACSREASPAVGLKWLHRNDERAGQSAVAERNELMRGPRDARVEQSGAKTQQNAIVSVSARSLSRAPSKSAGSSFSIKPA